MLDPVLNVDFMEKKNDDSSQFESLNALIAHNEELSAKLRAQIRKTAQFEAEIKELTKKNLALTDRMALLEEQILILRQKEGALYERIESGKQALANQAHLENEIQKLKSQIERHLRYQERIRTQVKPYIQNLKSIATESYQKNLALKETLNQKEAQISNLNEQVLRLQSEISHLKSEHDLQIKELKSHFKKERESFYHTLEEFKLENQELQKKATLVDIAHFRQNELENQLIALKAEADQKIEELRLKNAKLLSEISKMIPENQSLNQKVTELESQLEALKTNLNHSQSLNSSLEKQIQLLREEWSDKNSECEKLRLQLQALESLNLDLTNGLNLA
jgi:chromosome segregation ATPase